MNINTHPIFEHPVIIGKKVVRCDGFQAILEEDEDAAKIAKGIKQIRKKALKATGAFDREPDITIDVIRLSNIADDISDGKFLHIWINPDPTGPVVVKGHRKDKYAILMPMSKPMDKEE